jgi:hypothetical protein
LSGELNLDRTNPEARVAGLTVIGNAPPDISCPSGVPEFDLSAVEIPFVAWELEDSEGNRGVAEFAIEGLPSDALSPGDVVDLRELAVWFGDSYWGGYLSIERDGVPVLLLAAHRMPEFEGLPDLEVSGGEEACAGFQGDCLRPRDLAITVNGESGALRLHESALVGGYVIHNDAYFDNTGCGNAWGAVNPAFVVAMYLPP